MAAGNRLETVPAAAADLVLVVQWAIRRRPRQNKTYSNVISRVLVWQVANTLSYVLIAEDYPEVSKMYRISLEHAGYSIVIVGDGQECLKIYREAMQRQEREKSDGQPYAAVILDCRMPYMTCAEVAVEILAMNKRQRILIAAAYVSPTELALLNNPNIQILLKPFEPKDLVKLVQGISH